MVRSLADVTFASPSSRACAAIRASAAASRSTVGVVVGVSIEVVGVSVEVVGVSTTGFVPSVAPPAASAIALSFMLTISPQKA